MDVQTDNMDPPPCASQPSGKIRKGFKLFGKHKPGNIFSIRSKGDGNNKSPIRSKTLDGLSETAAPDSEQEPDKEKGQEVSQVEREQAEEEQLGEDGVLAAAPARTSISSVSSAKSLSFLSLLRGGRRGVGDRRVHTVSQPVGRQRRGLKGLFGNVKFLSKDKDDKEETPPSPLLMLSRANSVEIIKEDLTLTPKSQPRSLDSPETETIKSLTTQDSAATSPSETITPQVTPANVSRTNEHVSPLRTPALPLVPGDSSLSSLLADISSLLTFDSISGGGDIMADVEAEWGKASSAISAGVTEVTPSSTSLFSKPTISSPIKLSPVAIPPTVSSQSFTPLTKTASTSSPTAKPSTIITTLTKSSNLTTYSVKPSSDSTPASEPSTNIKIKSTPMPPATKPSTTLVALTSISAQVTSSPSITIKSTLSSTSTTATAPPNTPATAVKAPSVSPTLTSTASKLASETTAPAQVIASVSKPSPVPTPTPLSAKLPPVIHSPPTPVSFTEQAPYKLDSVSTSYKPILNSAAGASEAPVTVPPASTVIATTSSSALVKPSKLTTATTSAITSDSVSAALSKPKLPSTPIDLNKTPPSLVMFPSSTSTTTTKTQPSPPSLTSLDKIPSMTKHTPAPVALDKMSPAPTPTPVPTTHADITPPPPDLGQIPVSQIKAATAAVQIPISMMNDSSAPEQVKICHSKASPAPTHIPVSVSKDLPPPAQISVSAAKVPPAPGQISVSVSITPPPPAQISVSVAKDHFASTSAPCPVTSLASIPPLWSSEPSASAKMRGSGQASVDGHLASLSSTDSQKGPAVLSKTEEKNNESRTSLQVSSREKRTPQVKASGLSKIPVVGGGRAGKLPVRDSPHVDDEEGRVPPSPVLQEERPSFNSHDAEKKDKICNVEVNVPTSKHTQEESQQPPQPKVLTSLPRDSKIPVKHSTQSHAASQIPQAKEPHRSKIPVSKVPVRHVANKPAALGGSTQVRK